MAALSKTDAVFSVELMEMIREKIDDCAIGMRFPIDTLEVALRLRGFWGCALKKKVHGSLRQWIIWLITGISI